MKKILLVMIFICVIINLTACTGTKKETCVPLSEAPKEKRDAVLELSKQILDSIQKNDVQNIMSVTSDDAQQNSAEMEGVLEKINMTAQNNFKQLDNYYLTFSKTDTNRTPIIPNIPNYPYLFYVVPVSNEMAVLFSTVDNGSLTYLLTQIYALKNDEWKLYCLTFGEYAISGMKASDINSKMLKLQEDGFIVPAALYAQILEALVPPDIIMQYPDTVVVEYDIRDIKEQANLEYRFPITLKTERGDFEIISLQAGGYREGIGCTISYISHYSIEENKTALENEGKAILDAIDQYIPGMTENFDVFLMEAYEEQPVNQNKEYASYTTVITK